MLTAQQINAMTLHDVRWILDIFRDRILIWDPKHSTLVECGEVDINGTALQLRAGTDALAVGDEAELWAESRPAEPTVF